MGKILIKNGRVWDGCKFFRADVLTQGREIEKIAEGISEKADFVFDARDMIVSAGLVDAHIHIQGPEPDLYGITAEMGSIPFGAGGKPPSEKCDFCNRADPGKSAGLYGCGEKTGAVWRYGDWLEGVL